MKAFQTPLRVVFYKEDDQWIAHCLEFDLVGAADDKEQALELLNEAIEAQVQASIALKNPANLFSPAEGKFFLMFAEGTDVAAGNLSIKVQNRDFAGWRINEVSVREYLGGDLACV